MIERFGLDGDEPGRRDRLATTATCCSTSSSAASRCSASSRPRTSPTVGDRRRASRRVVEFFGARRRDAARRAEHAADLLLGNNVLAHVPDLNDFVAGMKILLEPDGVHHDGVPAPAAPDRGDQFDTIYHEHFSYFSFLTVSAVFERARPARCSTSRSCRPTAARCASTARHADDAASRDRARARELRERERAAGFDELDDLPRLRASASSATSARSSRFLIELKERGPRDRRLRRAGEGQHAAQLLRHRPRLHRLHRRPEPAQAGPLPARQPHPDPRARGDPRDAARRRADPAVEPQGRDRWSSSPSSASGAGASPRARRRSGSSRDQPSNGRPSTQPICRAGTPATIAPSGTERVTTALAPTTAFLPMVTPFEHDDVLAEPHEVADLHRRRDERLPHPLPVGCDAVVVVADRDIRADENAVADRDRLRRRHAEVPLDLHVVTDAHAPGLPAWLGAATASRRACARTTRRCRSRSGRARCSASSGNMIADPSPNAANDAATRRCHTR